MTFTNKEVVSIKITTVKIKVFKIGHPSFEEIKNFKNTKKDRFLNYISCVYEENKKKNLPFIL